MLSPIEGQTREWMGDPERVKVEKGSEATFSITFNSSKCLRGGHFFWQRREEWLYLEGTYLIGSLTEYIL